MEKENLRYSGPATVRRSYMKKFLVVCPKCKKLAIVTTNQLYDTSEDKLVCNNCNHSEKADELIRFNAIIKRNCDNCGNLIEITIPNNKEKTEELTIPCPFCGIARTYKPRNEGYKLFYKCTEICDPIFNLPLWFQTEIKGEIFWAYNREHLQEIKKYVSAKLRERQTTTHTTMVERLPNFIKSAKNRASILKAINKLFAKE
ncbi:hypothetical protein I5M27_05945 [Adhaeribacter sp. BT258]|uniref:Replication restart DNA helicase PriA n=1 Tax=Adhaeribacter terrigena TaxID=2793070 RepID=A0ABS1BZN5_9BACT|nr:hypothetical protein [Adhaeribacter terrigena]MBK0402518.1 hypothetical protein [Adhaeribacter terrigena]